jgi:GxxExxY protein
VRHEGTTRQGVNPLPGEELAVQRLDMIVDGKVVVELKAGASLMAGAQRQLYNYLRAGRLEVGLLLHFGLEPKFYRLFNEDAGRGGG